MFKMVLEKSVCLEYNIKSRRVKKMNFLTQPYLLSVNPSTEMNILWIQKEKTDGKVEYGNTKTLGNFLDAECFEIKGLKVPEGEEYREFPEDNLDVTIWQYIVKIENLSPGEKIYYRCFNENECTKIYDFHTAPEKGEDYKFAQISDLQGFPDCNKTVHKIGCHHPDFILYSGDATYTNWKLENWFDVGEEWQSEETRERAFFPCMQQENGARLMQYAPIFFCPGNHEVDDLRCYLDKEFGSKEENWNWSIFMQIFRPFYDRSDYSLKNGKRWYSANYSDMHIASLSINRFCFWDHDELPGWLVYDSIAPDSPQVK